MFKRHLEEKLFEALTYMPVVLLRGARQTGKTTLVKAVAVAHPPYNYLTFDQASVLFAAKSDPVGFITQLAKPVILDEIQRVPELFLPIKQDVDENRTPGRYLLTGSADPLLLPQLGDSLAGRMRLLNLWPLSQGEVAGVKETFLEKVFAGTLLAGGTMVTCSKEDLLNRVVLGGYPGPLQLLLETQRRDWFMDYMALVLQKDVLALANIENITQIPHLMTLLASRVGGLLNVEELARSVKLSGVTLHRYLALLRTLFLVHLLPAWDNNMGKRLVKSPKVYLTDTALQLFALNVDGQRLRQEPYLVGSVIENFVVLELLKQISWSRMSVTMSHYRDYGNVEVDIILEGPGGDLVAIEVKSSETLNSDDFKGLKRFAQVAGTKFKQGIVLYSGSLHLPFADRLQAVPIASLWT